MFASEAVRCYSMTAHEENGAYAERHYPDDSRRRPDSGCIYYYLAPGEVSMFHIIDCDEYWVWCAGTPLEIWQIDPSGSLSISLLGLGSGMEPAVRVRKGVCFGAKQAAGQTEMDGTFVTCITVPRFRYDGWRLVPKDDVIRSCKEASAFFADQIK